MFLDCFVTEDAKAKGPAVYVEQVVEVFTCLRFSLAPHRMLNGRELFIASEAVRRNCMASPVHGRPLRNLSRAVSEDRKAAS